MYYIWLFLAVICIGYYIVCVSYAGVGSSFIFIWLLLACFFTLIFGIRLLEIRRLIRVARWLKISFWILFSLGMMLFITLETMIIVSMSQKPDDDCDYLIVLGCQIRGTTVTKSLKRRLDSAYDYAAKNEKVIIIVSGGQGKGEDISEAQAMYEYLTARGIDKSRIIREDQSTDTNENMQYSAGYIENSEAKVGIVTNNFHIFRSKALARAKGMNHLCGVPSASDEVLFVNYMVREAIGIVKDFCFGNLTGRACHKS